MVDGPHTRSLEGSPWQVLGVEPTTDEQAIRRAYAALVRQYRPDSHPAEFAKVREAYEHALHLSRHLQWQEEVDAAQASSVAEPDMPEQAPEAPVEVVANGMAVTAAEPQEEVEPPPEPELAIPVFDPQQALSDLAAAYNEQGDMAAAALLHDHIALTAQSTIDARLDYEWLFLRSLLVSETPPLALVFEGDRCFRWSSRFDDVARMFDDRGARRLAELIEMADQWMFSRSFAANPWQRRLFADPKERMPWFGMSSLVFGARAVVTRWAAQCGQLQTPLLEGRLHPVARRRVSGAVLLSSDIVLGLLAFWVFASIGFEKGFSWLLVLAGLGTGAITTAACVGFRWVNRQPWMARVHALKPWTGGWRLVVAGSVIGAAFVGALIFGGSDQPLAARIAAGIVSALLLAGFLLAIGGLFWSIAFALESLVSQLWLKPLWAVSSQSFRHVRDNAAPGWQPMTFVQKVRAAPAAMAADRAARKRDAAEQALRQPFEKPKSSFNGWWIFFIIVAAINAARLLTK